MANPEHLEEQREETRLIIEELLKTVAIRTRCTPSSTISLRMISTRWKNWPWKPSSWVTK